MIVFHHNDLDGRCAAAVVYAKYGATKTVRLKEVDYDTGIPFDEIEKGEMVYIVDFSIPEEDMAKLKEITSNIVWIDHHATSLRRSYNTKELKGRRSVKESGCALTWRYLYPDKTLPRSVLLISDMDTWTYDYGTPYSGETAEFTAGMMARSQDPRSKLWKVLFTESDRATTLLTQIKAEGAVCIEFRNNMARDYVAKYGFSTTFEGYSSYALGMAIFGSLVFGDRISKYDVLISFEFDGSNYHYGLYSEKVDVSMLAQKYGGGGHKGAAGFRDSSLLIKREG